jgi:hypothetical protein
VIIGIMATVFLVPFLRDFFEFTLLTQDGLIVITIIIACGIALFEILRNSIHHISAKYLTELNS